MTTYLSLTLAAALVAGQAGAALAQGAESPAAERAAEAPSSASPPSWLFATAPETEVRLPDWARGLEGATDEAYTQASPAADRAPGRVSTTSSASGSPFFTFYDTQVSYRFAPTAAEPGIPSSKSRPPVDIQKNIFAITHANSWAYGSNFINVDVLKSGIEDPVKGGGDGATEVYALYRGILSGNALTATKAFSFGPIRDLRLGFGGDLNSKNTNFAAQKRLLVVGPNIAFDLPGGFLNLGINYSQEDNHNGVTNRHVAFDPAFEMELTYSIPLTFTGLPLTLAGFDNFIGPKGRDGFNRQTKTEILSRTNLVLDIGKLAFNTPNTVDVFVGYQYWYNKFGNDHRIVAGSIESTVLLGVAIHAPK